MRHSKLTEVLRYDEKESKLFMPNEIFEDLTENIQETSSHIGFAYSFYYLTTWLYRHCKYIEHHYDRGLLKEILGYSKTNKTVDYLIKHEGILDKINYTRTSNDFPLRWWLDEFNDPEFELFSEMEERVSPELKDVLTPNRRNKSIKVPVKAFFRYDEAEEINYWNGTFYEIDNTHLVPFEVFLHCMSNESELGCEAFYLYGFFKFKNDKFQRGCDISLEEITSQTGRKKLAEISICIT
ncbi:hypothetical protein [Halobacillus aidingensis]|uniref:Uncharacterized protein n=1 Tax=Halobacillus aidingensis TaxID=240303 RepID=A0A1H0S8Q7_HALAD|nr:hypothetical protein [Halobacillus aidingensis]SDP38162.1 hypothetical protein SAMN05421677_11769 [Halobacillus aidingensis]